MGRTIPYECPHGRTLDWGDFGPDPDDGSVGVDRCEKCEVETLMWGQAGQPGYFPEAYQ
jgi:hypothetical protein